MRREMRRLPGVCVLTMIRKGMMKMTEQEIMEMFAGGFDCSQVALVSAADRLGIEREEALKLSSAFGEVCTQVRHVERLPAL